MAEEIEDRINAGYLALYITTFQPSDPLGQLRQVELNKPVRRDVIMNALRKTEIQSFGSYGRELWRDCRNSQIK